MVSLSLSNAPVEEVLESFAEIGKWRLELSRPLVSLELVDTTIHEALDKVCSQVDCTWSLDQTGGRGVLRIGWADE